MKQENKCEFWFLTRKSAWFKTVAAEKKKSVNSQMTYFPIAKLKLLIFLHKYNGAINVDNKGST